jgi:hypothetical protein
VCNKQRSCISQAWALEDQIQRCPIHRRMSMNTFVGYWCHLPMAAGIAEGRDVSLSSVARKPHLTGYPFRVYRVSGVYAVNAKSPPCARVLPAFVTQNAPPWRVVVEHANPFAAVANSWREPDFHRARREGCKSRVPITQNLRFCRFCSQSPLSLTFRCLKRLRNGPFRPFARP